MAKNRFKVINQCWRADFLFERSSIPIYFYPIQYNEKYS